MTHPAHGPATPPENLLKALDFKVIQQCMHCGMCLPTCPTYDATGRERNSPRGRISLMRAVADGALPVDKPFAQEMSYCLGCLACQSACPAGVDYAHLLESARAEVERTGVAATPSRSFYRWLALRVLFTRPWLLRLVGRLIATYQLPAVRGTIVRLGLLWLLPSRLRALEPRAPKMDPPWSDARIAPVESPSGQTRYRVALLTGCVQDLAYARVNRATVDVLLRAGCQVHTPRAQYCCGSLHAHNGDTATARELARRQLDNLDLGSIDAIISNAGGCGSHLRHYARLLADDPAYLERAERWDAKLRDIHEWLAEIGAPAPAGTPSPQRVAYDDSCHLCHGQGVRSQPRMLMGLIPGLELVPLVESEWCCGSAGVYSITQPDQAQKLLDRKLDHIERADVQVLATSNPGCDLQLRIGALQRPKLAKLRVCHPVELLAEAYSRDTGGP